MNQSFNKSVLKRREKILEELEVKGQTSVLELSKTFNKSEITIRKDLAKLEENNMLFRTKGGAKRNRIKKIVRSSNIADKTIQSQQEKQLAIEAIKLIEEEDAIILNFGSITTLISKNLGQFKNLTIITNALNIASILSGYERFNIFIPGGFLCKKSLSTMGIVTETFEKIYCDKLFLCAEGFDPKSGLSASSAEKANLIQAMMKISKEVIIIVDSKKLRSRSIFHSGSISNINIIITDSGVKKEDIVCLERENVQVIVASDITTT